MLKLLAICLKSNLGSLASSIGTLIVVLVIAATSTTYGLAYPSYIETEQRFTYGIPWSAQFDFEQDDQASIERLQGEIEEAFNGAPTILSENSDAILARSNDISSIRSLSEFDFVDAKMLHQNPYGLNPLNAYSSNDFIISGNPNDFQGMIIDAIIAQKYGLRDGDEVLVGMVFPENSENAVCFQNNQVNYDEDVNSDIESSSDDVGDDYWIGFVKERIAAIVAPGGDFSGIALYRPEENIQAMIEQGNSYATQIYLYQQSDSEIEKIWSNISKAPEMEGVYIWPASKSIEQATDLYDEEKGGMNYAITGIFAAAIILFGALAFNSIRLLQNSSAILSSMIVCGSTKARAIGAYLLSLTLIYGVILSIGIIIGIITAKMAFPIWVPDSLQFCAVGIGVLILALVLVLLWVLMQRKFSDSQLVKILGGPEND